VNASGRSYDSHVAADRSAEPILEPDLPVVDAHHHLWFMPAAAIDAMETAEVLVVRELAAMYRKYARYLSDELLADLTSGHNVIATVYCDAHAMYRAGGPPELQSVGEVEFVNGVAAMGASGLWGDIRPCAGIVGGVDLRLGDALEDVLAAHVAAGGGRYRGVRGSTLYDEDAAILGGGEPQVLLDPRFRKGAEALQRLGLSLDVMVLEPQLPDVIELARALPQLQIVLNHCGAPVGVGRYEGRREERFPLWQTSIRELALCENVVVKLGGLGIPFPGFASYGADPPAGSEQLANEWRPYVEGCIEAFGPDRCMFESNVPPDGATAAYPVLWNAFKRITAGASSAEKAALYSGTAIRVYRLELD
jgi:predicted TIM-barrel fold metal-dependent hydrolase